MKLYSLLFFYFYSFLSHLLFLLFFFINFSFSFFFFLCLPLFSYLLYSRFVYPTCFFTCSFYEHSLSILSFAFICLFICYYLFLLINKLIFFIALVFSFYYVYSDIFLFIHNLSSFSDNYSHLLYRKFVIFFHKFYIVNL